MAVRGETRVARSKHERILAVIRSIPRGRVATYGQVAELADLPRGHRVVATVLRTSDANDRLPWHRVLGRASRTTARIAPSGIVAREQRKRLRAEKIAVDRDGRVALATFGWLPLDWEPG